MSWLSCFVLGFLKYFTLLIGRGKWLTVGKEVMKATPLMFVDLTHLSQPPPQQKLHRLDLQNKIISSNMLTTQQFGEQHFLQLNLLL